MSNIEVGLRIKSLRKNSGKTQVQMAEIIGVSRSNYAYYETGKSKPPIEKMKIIADYFNTTTDYLLDGVLPETASIDIGEKLVELINLAKSNYIDVNFRGKKVTKEMRSVLIQSTENVESILMMLSKPKTTRKKAEK